MKAELYLKPKMTEIEVESLPMMLETSEIGFGEGGGDANGMRPPFAPPLGGNPFNPSGGFGF